MLLCINKSELPIDKAIKRQNNEDGNKSELNFEINYCFSNANIVEVTKK